MSLKLSDDRLRQGWSGTVSIRWYRKGGKATSSYMPECISGTKVLMSTASGDVLLFIGSANASRTIEFINHLRGPGPTSIEMTVDFQRPP